MSAYCCERMAYDLGQTCGRHTTRYECPDALIAHARDGFGIIVHDGGTSVIEINFCPWCGKRLQTGAISD
jgi:uncharacterized protein DUF6980